MGHLLADLDQGDPVVGCEFLAAVVALRVFLDELDDLGYLDFHGFVQLAVEDYF